METTVDLGLPVERIESARHRLAAEVLPHYGAAVEPVQTDPRTDLGEIDDQRGEQSVTLLHSLGYLPEPAAGREHRWPAAAIAAAWADWLADWHEWVETDEAGRAVAIALGDEALGGAGDDCAALRALKACATLEGEVMLARWPEPGRTTLASRIALYRLRLYGLASFDPDGAMPPGLDALLQDWARNLAADRQAMPAHELVNRLGSLHGLTDELLGRLGDCHVLLAEPEESAELGLAETESLVTDGGRTIRVLDLRNPASRDLNRLTLRVLQVRLWTLGYYDGAIDGEWRALSERALTAFADDYELGRHRAYIGAVASGRVVLDAAKILRCFTESVDAVAEDTGRVAIDAALAGAERGADAAFWDALAEAREADRANAAAASYSYDGEANVVARGENVRRVRYFGWRGIFAAFGRLLRKGGDFVRRVIEAAGAAVRRLSGLLRSIARYVVDATRVAMRVAALAVQRLKCWLTGTPVVTRGEAHLVATYWQRDFDTVNLIAAGAPVGLLERHVQTLDWMQRSLEAMLRVGLAIAQALLALGNWLLFAWRALLVVRQILREVADPGIRELVAETAPI